MKHESRICRRRPRTRASQRCWPRSRRRAPTRTRLTSCSTARDAAGEMRRSAPTGSLRRSFGWWTRAARPRPRRCLRVRARALACPRLPSQAWGPFRAKADASTLPALLSFHRLPGDPGARHAQLRDHLQHLRVQAADAGHQRRPPRVEQPADSVSLGLPAAGPMSWPAMCRCAAECRPSEHAARGPCLPTCRHAASLASPSPTARCLATLLRLSSQRCCRRTTAGSRPQAPTPASRCSPSCSRRTLTSRPRHAAVQQGRRLWQGRVPGGQRRRAARLGLQPRRRLNAMHPCFRPPPAAV